MTPQIYEKTNPPETILKRLEKLQDKYWKILANTKIQKVNDVFEDDDPLSK